MREQRLLNYVAGRVHLTVVAAALSMASVADAQPFAYVVAQRDDPGPGNSGVQVVTVIDTNTNTKVATIPVGLSCFCVNNQALALAPDNAKVYVANELSASVSVISTATNTVLGTIAVASSPVSVAVSPEGGRLYVLHGFESSVSVIDTATGTLQKSIPLDIIQAQGMALSPDGSKIYVTTFGSNTVKIVDTTSNTVVSTVAVGNLPTGVDVSPDGSRVFVSNSQSNTVSVIDTATATAGPPINVGQFPLGIRVTPDGSRIYSANATSGTLTVINAQTNSVAGTVTGVPGVRAIDFLPDGTRAYVAGQSSVRIVDTLANVVVETIPFNTATEGFPGTIVVARPPRLPNVGAPADLMVASVVDNVVTLRWTVSPGIHAPTNFVLEGGVQPGQVLASIGTNSTAPIFTFTAPQGAFYIRLHAIAGAERSTPSNEVRLFVNVPAPPSAPIDLVGVVDGSSLALAWRNTFAGGAPTSIVLLVSGTLSASIPLGRTDRFSFSGVPAGTYVLRVVATNASGVSAASNPLTLTFPAPCSGPPPTPIGFIVYKTGARISLRWDPSGSGPAPTSYIVNVTGAFVGVLPISERSVSAVVGAGTYNISVAARNSCGSSPATPPQAVTVP